VLLQAASQYLPAQQRAALQAGNVVRVSSWQQLVDAVSETQEKAGAAAQRRVFELAPGTTLVADSTLQLGPGMAVVAAGARRGQPAGVRISCKEGLQSAFDVRLATAGATPR
jgi:hypothetical protein